jgi:hypothetical protein
MNDSNALHHEPVGAIFSFPQGINCFLPVASTFFAEGGAAIAPASENGEPLLHAINHRRYV